MIKNLFLLAYLRTQASKQEYITKAAFCIYCAVYVLYATALQAAEVINTPPEALKGRFS
jgi:hypothetical protein